MKDRVVILITHILLNIICVLNYLLYKSSGLVCLSHFIFNSKTFWSVKISSWEQLEPTD